MKKLLFIAIVAVFAACSGDDEEVTPIPTPTPTPAQSAALMGGWNLDSTLEDTLMLITGHGFAPPLYDSIHFSVFSSGPDFHSFAVSSSGVVTPVSSSYCWDTSSDYLYFRMNSHHPAPQYTLQYYISGNKLVLKWTAATLALFASHPGVVECYYHR